MKNIDTKSIADGSYLSRKVKRKQVVISGNSIQNHPFPELSRHAISQASKRNISQKAIDTALMFGTRLEVSDKDAVYFILRRKDLKRADLPESLNGTVVVVSQDNQAVITTYINKKITRRLKKRLIKFRRQPKNYFDLAA